MAGTRDQQAGAGAGHHVTCLARGESGAAVDGATLVVADRADPHAYDAVEDRDWDAVIEVAWQPAFVRGPLDALAPRVRHWCYVPSGSVYATHAQLDAEQTDATAASRRQAASV